MSEEFEPISVRTEQQEGDRLEAFAAALLRHKESGTVRTINATVVPLLRRIEKNTRGGIGTVGNRRRTETGASVPVVSTGQGRNSRVSGAGPAAGRSGSGKNAGPAVAAVQGPGTAAKQGPARTGTSPSEKKAEYAVLPGRAGSSPGAPLVAPAGSAASPSSSTSGQAVQAVREKRQAEEQRKGLAGAIKDSLAGWNGEILSERAGSEDASDAAGTMVAGAGWGALQEVKDLASTLTDATEDPDSLAGIMRRKVEDKTGVTAVKETLAGAKDKAVGGIMQWATGEKKPGKRRDREAVPPGAKRDKNGRLRDANGRFIPASRTAARQGRRESAEERQAEALETLVDGQRLAEKAADDRNEELTSTLANVGENGGGGGAGFLETAVGLGLWNKIKNKLPGGGMLGKIRDVFKGGTGKAAGSVLKSGGKAAGGALKYLKPVGNMLKGSGKLLGRVAAPLAVLAGLPDVVQAVQKGDKEEIGSSTGSIAGGLGGAAAGAALGTAILPGVGTLVGGAIGAFAGDWLGSKAGGAIGGWFGGDKGDQEARPAPKAKIKGSQELGDLSARYESGQNGSDAIGYDRTGGTSYGKYQIASKTGTYDRFLDWADQNGGESGKVVAARLRGAGPGNTGKAGGAAADEWKELVADGTMGSLEHDFIKATHFDPAVAGLKSDDLRKRIEQNKALQDVVWSTSVQHGGRGASGILNKAYKDGMSDEDLVKAVYQERGTRFGSSSSRVQSSVQRRFQDEQTQALAMLDQPQTAQPVAVARVDKKPLQQPTRIKNPEVEKHDRMQKQVDDLNRRQAQRDRELAFALAAKDRNGKDPKQNRDSEQPPAIRTEFDDPTLTLMAYDRV